MAFCHISINHRVTYTLTAEALKLQLEANLNDDLRANIKAKPILAEKLTPWSLEVKDRDDRLCNENIHMQHLIEANNTTCTARRTEKRSFLNQQSDPDPPAGLSKSVFREKNTPDSKYLPKLMDTEKMLLNEHDGCTHCCTLYACHHSNNCPMKATNTWPDAEMYRLLTTSMAQAETSSHITAAYTAVDPYDDDTDDLYVPPFTHFTIPHLYAMLNLTGPSIVGFPLSMKALLDIGCPSTVISATLVEQLGLHCFALPAEEDNLSSLSDSPLQCKDSHHHDSGDPEFVPPPPTPKKVRIKKVDFNDISEPALVGYLLPEPIMAAVREQIKVLSGIQLMEYKDAEYKKKYANRFPL
ncbi:hypothetical protein M422DRAFT_259304 [Sphaerobolus stellatus SS14]|uniref:Uncharacterized protein n=1 Tax=Sphaerobolus stellatus (strain SS14) TaxID=990650 RepID=A0A0C9VK95_SPHS4|nr:hypothetical protein M422DRAFT_259304 [Sphaerobolus stellatus SS14]